MIRAMFLMAALWAGAGTAALAEGRQGAEGRTEAAPADDRHPECDAGTDGGAVR
jgi:hypothetical protein